MKEIVFVILDEFADWEGSFLSSALRSGLMPGRSGTHAVKYLTPDGQPVRSLGGLRVEADCDASALPDGCGGLILIGGLSWRTPIAERIAPQVAEALGRGIPVGAICNAASFLAAHGFLNRAEHTGNTLAMLKEWGGSHYTGEALYRERQSVSDGGIVTANGSGYLEFTRDCLLALRADDPEIIEAYYRFNREGLYRL